ncbi:MAG: hypothetical protein ACOCY8_01330 [Spirochaetota bacterium]
MDQRANQEEVEFGNGPQPEFAGRQSVDTSSFSPPTGAASTRFTGMWRSSGRVLDHGSGPSNTMRARGNGLSARGLAILGITTILL